MLLLLLLLLVSVRSRFRPPQQRWQQRRQQQNLHHHCRGPVQERLTLAPRAGGPVNGHTSKRLPWAALIESTMIAIALLWYYIQCVDKIIARLEDGIGQSIELCAVCSWRNQLDFLPTAVLHGIPQDDWMAHGIDGSGF